MTPVPLNTLLHLLTYCAYVGICASMCARCVLRSEDSWGSQFSSPTMGVGGEGTLNSHSQAWWQVLSHFASFYIKLKLELGSQCLTPSSKVTCQRAMVLGKDLQRAEDVCVCVCVCVLCICGVWCMVCVCVWYVWVWYVYIVCMVWCVWVFTLPSDLPDQECLPGFCSDRN